MRDTSDLRAWYKEDILHLLRAIRSSSVFMDENQRNGFDLAIVSMCEAVGIEPEMVGIKTH